MNEKLPLLHQTIAHLEKQQSPLAWELNTLVQELLVRLKKKQDAEVTETKEKITAFLKDHETDDILTSWATDLEELNAEIHESWTATWTKKKKSSRRSTFWGGRGEEDEKVVDTPETPAPEEDDAEDLSRRERPRAKVLWLWALIGAGIYAFKNWKGVAPHTNTLQPIASSSVESASSEAYEKASPDMKRGYCFHYLQQIWFSNILAAWIVGNIEQESWFDTKAIGDNWAAHCLCQRRDGRREDLQNFCASTLGKWRSIYDYTLQLDFIKFELEGKERDAYTYLIKAKTAAEAAKIFVQKYERAGTPHEEKRIAYANKALEQDMRNIA